MDELNAAIMLAVSTLSANTNKLDLLARYLRELTAWLESNERDLLPPQ